MIFVRKHHFRGAVYSNEILRESNTAPSDGTTSPRKTFQCLQNSMWSQPFEGPLRTSGNSSDSSESDFLILFWPIQERWVVQRLMPITDRWSVLRNRWLPIANSRRPLRSKGAWAMLGGLTAGFHWNPVWNPVEWIAVPWGGWQSGAIVYHSPNFNCFAGEHANKINTNLRSSRKSSPRLRRLNCDDLNKKPKWTSFMSVCAV